MNTARLATAALPLALAACQPSGAEKFDAPYGVSADQLVAQNGLSANGISANGLSANGLSANGLSANGLSTSTLSSTAFRTWFNSDTSLNPTLMKYLVHCAAPSSQTITWTNPSTGVTYNWTGGVGLATSYASGSSPTTAEKQVVSACLAAHVNKYGRQVTVAVEGKTATGSQIPMVTGELTTYSKLEGAFFGSLYDAAQGIYSCAKEFASASRSKSSLRACAMDYSPGQASDDCAPIVNVGSCASICTLDGTGTYYTTCTYGGQSYKPITTWILPADIYSCGDGTCQVTESKGKGSTFDSCKADCGD